MQLRVLNCFLDNRFGGPHRRACIVAQKLRMHDIETVFLFNEKLRANIPIKDFRCYLLRHLQCITRQSTVVNLLLFSFLFPFSLYKIYKIIKSEKINIVHTNGVTNILPALAAKLSGVKVVWHLNDTLTPWVIRKFFLSWLRLFSNKVVLAAKKVGLFYFGDSGKLWNKSTVLYAPVDVARFNRDTVEAKRTVLLKRELNVSAGDYLVGAVGNINRAKGYEYFVEAAKLIKEKLGRVKFIIVGEKLDSNLPYYERIRNQINSAHLEKDFILTGFRDNMPEVLSVFNVMVLSSISEACPIAVLEAMAMKVPVVATNVGGVVEQVINGESGILVEPRRPDLLANAVFEILNTPKQQLDAMLNKGRKRATDVFSLDIIAEKHKHVYNEVLSTNKKALLQ